MLDQLRDQVRALVRRLTGAGYRPPLHRDPSFHYAVQADWGRQLIPARAPRRDLPRR